MVDSMHLWHGRNHVSLAFYREGDCLQVALLHKQKQTPDIKLLRTFVLSEKKDVKPLYALASVLEKKDFYTVSALTATESLFRKTSVQAVQKKDVKEGSPFFSRRSASIDKEEGHFVFQITPQQSSKNFRNLLFRTTKTSSRCTLRKWQALRSIPII